MAYAVTIDAGYSKITTRFPTPEMALAAAREEVERESENVTVTVASTHETFTVDEFAAKVAEGFPAVSGAATAVRDG